MKIQQLPPDVAFRALQLEGDARTASSQARDAVAALENARRQLSSLTRGNDREAIRAAEEALPTLMQEAHDTEGHHEHLAQAVDKVRSWLDNLPDDTVLEPYVPKLSEEERTDPAAALRDVRAALREATAERTSLLRVPVPSHDIRERVERYVAELGDRGRPYVRGVGDGQQLSVRWAPSLTADREVNTANWVADTVHPLLMAALLQPEALVTKIMVEIEHDANTPMQVAERTKRIATFGKEIDELQRRASDLVYTLVQTGVERAYDASTPAAALLGVRVVERKARAA